MTLTYPILNRSRRILWVVTGKEKAEMLARLRDGDGRSRRARAPRHGLDAGRSRGSGDCYGLR